MAINYSKPLPKDAGSSEAMQEYPPATLSVARITSENATTSSVITLNDQTTMLEVAAIGASAAFRWVPTSDTQASVVTIAGASSNYDHVIPSGTLRRFVVPQERQAITSIAGANVMNGLYSRVAWKTIGVGSIMSSQF